jgi:hypothetical protein
LREAIEAVDAETNHVPAFYGINCSHPVEFEPALEPGNWFRARRERRRGGGVAPAALRSSFFTVRQEDRSIGQKNNGSILKSLIRVCDGKSALALPRRPTRGELLRIIPNAGCIRSTRRLSTRDDEIPDYLFKMDRAGTAATTPYVDVLVPLRKVAHKVAEFDRITFLKMTQFAKRNLIQLHKAQAGGRSASRCAALGHWSAVSP